MVTGLRLEALPWLCVFVALAVDGCGGHQDGTSATDGSGVRGRTLIDGGCPVVQAGTPCPDRPVAARLEISRSDSSDSVATVVSNDRGRFVFDVPPGSYTVAAHLPDGTAPTGQDQAIAVTVRPGEYSDVVIRFDTGIR